ncbi:bifunctional precorrin-2 dehydrogenase/sirohydrochlorin ferrochelatase [Turicibacter sanguinis]|uniref:precorrin-2 dehydrogenase/sirohydrochlorin ferrochelatase family protein n=1 Tax=Turicibacter sanguinis TaxID=154288 RepID=UPI00232BE4E3|nr:bifunctional precorrin-2 dehydrogenase/sirohydrochlorin ferrochelatase [Turicibacter sanguinis]MDB8543684.1 bifunctional precorrin-2 dehydrogenase/sirohydrochlorin ferrochelatase [Turicibacter sanguinis]
MLYPVNLELDQFEIVIVGGGEVAYRKCKNFLEFNKSVKVIAPHFLDSFYELENVVLVQDKYDERYIESSQIVVAATDNRLVNEEISKYCHQHKKLVNVVDNRMLSNYIVPSYVKRGDLLLSVSTGGKSPALAKKISRELAVEYDDSYEEYVNLLGSLREAIMKRYEDVGVRRKLIKELISLDYEALKEESRKYL